MTLPNNETKTLLKAVRALVEKALSAGLSIEKIAADIDISTTTVEQMMKYKRDYNPGKYVEMQLRAWVKKIRQKCPVEK